MKLFKNRNKDKEIEAEASAKSAENVNVYRSRYCENARRYRMKRSLRLSWCPKMWEDDIKRCSKNINMFVMNVIHYFRVRAKTE